MLTFLKQMHLDLKHTHTHIHTHTHTHKETNKQFTVDHAVPFGARISF